MFFQLTLGQTGLLTEASATLLLLDIFKWLLVIVAGLYLFVAMIIVRQIGLMRATVTVPHTVRLQLLSYLHFIAAVLLLLYFVLVL